MDKKGKETFTNITACENLHDAITSISNNCKGSENFDAENLPDRIQHQWKILEKVFSEHIVTMRQASHMTGIDRANICWFIYAQREKKTIWKCGFCIDPLSKSRAGLWTMCKECATAHYIEKTRPYWSDLPTDGQKEIFTAIDSYLTLWDFGVFISASVSHDDDVLAIWYKVQECIDESMK